MGYVKPDKFGTLLLESELSQRWQRVAIGQAAGVSQSWLTNREAAYKAYLQELVDYEDNLRLPNPNPKLKLPVWKDWNILNLKATTIQANVNVVTALEPEDSAVLKLERAHGQPQHGQFDYWLKVATLEKYKPIYLPIKLSKYHKQMLEGHLPNTSTTLSKREDGSWWLTLTITEEVIAPSPNPEAVIGVDVGIKNFITSSQGKQYGSFSGNLATQHKADRQKRKRKAKLIACLKKKGLPKEKLPSTSSRSGQKLARQVKQSINRSVNLLLDDLPEDVTVVYEELNVASMRFKARAMNAYLYASNLGHIPKQMAWACAKRGIATLTVNPAYSSQQCPKCNLACRDNRKTQETFSCKCCSYAAPADYNAACNLANRANDPELLQCHNKEEIKALLALRHQRWLIAQT